MPLTGRYIVMGVAGSGKSHIGAALAARLGAEFIDGDDLHPAENIAKMSRAEPLTDADRAPWLKVIGTRLGESKSPLVIACSALKRRYRDMIIQTAGAPVTFLYLDGDRNLLAARMGTRKDHFMPSSLLESQLEALEKPDASEGAITASIDQSPEAVVAALLAGLERNDP